MERNYYQYIVREYVRRTPYGTEIVTVFKIDYLN